MSEPPPGYNAGESMLQGGTATIVPVMGGGRIKRALKQIRKKRTRKASGRKPNRTRRPKRRQTGGSNHYDIPKINKAFVSKADGLISVKVTSAPVPTNPTMMDTVNTIDVVPEYLKQVAKLWVRKINAPFFSYSEFKSKLPTSDNIGCNSGFESLYRVDKLVRYAPDRLCCVLPRETKRITLLPAIQGNVDTFMRVMTILGKDLAQQLSHRVYIFSPPFYGDNTEANSQLFTQYLKYKTTQYKNTKGEVLDVRFYILMEHAIKNIEAVKLVSRDIATVFADKNNKKVIIDLSGALINKNKIEATKTLGIEVITALHPMLEPSYIIYPYTLEFPLVSMASLVGTAGKLTAKQYKDALAKLDSKLADANAAQKQAEDAVPRAEQAYNSTAGDVVKLQNAYSIAAGELSKANEKVKSAEADIAATTLSRDSLGATSPEFANLTAQILNKTTALEQLKTAQGQAKEKQESANAELLPLAAKANTNQENLNEAKRNLQNKTTYYKGIVTECENAKRELSAKNPSLASPAASSVQETGEQKGGLLFSAATKGEPILPAPYSGFDGAINYVQTHDGNSARGSIAYRVDLNQREPLLDAMNYKEYNLLLAPPMNAQSMFMFTFTDNTDTRVLSSSDTQEAFVENPYSSHMRVPGVPITVGTLDFVLRSPVPDVVADWKNGIYTADEAEYLNSMRLSPKILKQVFGDSWKSQLSDHLSMISRSKCFKDPRLLLHADCQQAQGFVSQVLKYYMENSNEIIKAEQRDRDASTSLLQKRLDALAAALAGNNSVSADSIFDVIPFIKTFYPRANADSGTYISSVSPTIRVNRVSDTFIVTFSREDTLGIEQQQAIATKLDAPFTINVERPPSPSEDGIYTWKFQKEVNEYVLSKAARRQVSSFSIDETQPYGSTPQSTIDVFYFGKLSPEDTALIRKEVKFKEGNQTVDPPLPSNVRRWTLDLPMSEDVAQKHFNSIANTNKYNLTLTRNPNVDYSKVTVGAPSLNFANNTLNLVFMMREIKSPGVDISAQLSLSLKAGLSIPNSEKLLQTEFNRIAEEANKLPRETAAFGGKYAISNPR